MEPQDWRARVDQAVQRAQAQKGPRYGAPKTMLRFRGSAHELVKQAADARGLSVASFVRRSTLAMVAASLGRDYDEIIAYDPRIQRVDHTLAEDPSGRLCGPWEIVALR